jgi:uncharacterized protein YndB with AHSA1/START domain
MDRDDFTPTPLADVSCRPDGDRRTLVFVRPLRHPPEKVWRALTEQTQLREWAPFVPDRDLDHVGDAVLDMNGADEPEPFPATVRIVDPPRLLEYLWGDDVLRWELEPTPTGTQLTLHHTVEDDDMVPKVTAGWHLCLDVAELLLDGGPVGPIVGRDAMELGWQDLHDAYARALGLPTA